MATLEGPEAPAACHFHPLGCPEWGEPMVQPQAAPVRLSSTWTPAPREPLPPTVHESIREQTRLKRRRVT